MNVFGEIRNLVIASLEKMQVSGDLPDGLSFDLVTVCLLYTSDAADE